MPWSAPAARSACSTWLRSGAAGWRWSRSRLTTVLRRGAGLKVSATGKRFAKKGKVSMATKPKEEEGAVLRDWTQTKCPECGHDVKLSDELEGKCKHCGLDVGALVQRHRLEDGLAKMREAEAKKAEEERKRNRSHNPFDW
jgi:rRNA maturation protein Nop10